MKIIELLNKCNKDDIVEYLTTNRRSSFSDKNATRKLLDIFFSDINEIKLTPIPEDEQDFIVMVSDCYDDLEDYDEIKAPEDVRPELLHVYPHVNGFNESDLLNHKDSLSLSFNDVIKGDSEFIKTYGLDLLPRNSTLQFNVCPISIDKLGEVKCAAEIFYELTYYGLTEKDNQEVSKEIDNRSQSADDYVKPDNYTDEDEIDFDYTPPTKEEQEIQLAIALKISELNFEKEKEIFKLYLEELTKEGE